MRPALLTWRAVTVSALSGVPPAGSIQAEWLTRKRRIDPALDACGWRRVRGRAHAAALRACRPAAAPTVLRRTGAVPTRRGANASVADALLVDDMPELPASWRYTRLDHLAAENTAVT